MRTKKLTLGLLIFYLIALTWIVVFKMQFSIADLPHFRSVNLIPFSGSVIINGQIYFSEIIENVLAFIPFGLFIHILWQEKPLLKQLAPIIATSLLFEVFQFIFSVGGTDITDIITNSLGGIIGIFIAIFIYKISNKYWIKFINILSLIGAIFLVLFIAILLFANM